VERILPTFVNQPGVPLIRVSSLECNDAKSETRATFAQRRFLVDAGGQSEAGRWQVPVCVTAGAAGAPPACHVLTEAQQTVPVARGCAPWIFANAGARGYYRTEYTPALLRAMAPHVATGLTAPERFALIDDEWALVRTGRHTVADYLTLIAGFGREHTSGILNEVADRLGFVRGYLTTSATATRFEVFARTLVRPLLDELGFEASAAEPDDRRALRAGVVLALGTTGNDSEVIAQARAALDRSLSGAASLDPTLAETVTTIAAAHGDARLFDALAAAVDRAASPDDQYRFLYALAEFQDPALIDRGLQRALSPQLRSQDTSIYLARFFDNSAARARAWAFVKEHWTALQPKIAVFGGDTALVHALGSFCDARARADIASFFASHPLPGAVRTLDQTRERIDNCIALRASQTAMVERWLQTP
jgi:aminopeptidase N/puromycin-sensitive aminopeptidase